MKKKVKRYPWSNWFLQDFFVLKKRQDFDVPPYSMAQQIRNKAAKLGVMVSIKIDGPRLHVSVVDRST